ncbi:hypothetical protein [Halomonas denitrificans]|nr:hypothetical protein [Halomonas denitrificans]
MTVAHFRLRCPARPCLRRRTIAGLVLLLVSTAPAATAQPGDSSLELDGLAVPGEIRAHGVYGAFGVDGVLSFAGGELCWTIDDEQDCAPVEVIRGDGYLRFASEHRGERDERVEWSGRYDGHALSDVTVLWTRVEGDAVHDLLLPERLVLGFEPSGADLAHRGAAVDDR